jgi:hypothetical protein
VEDVENPLLEAQEKLADSTILFCQVRGFQAPFSSSRKAIPGTMVQCCQFPGFILVCGVRISRDEPILQDKELLGIIPICQVRGFQGPYCSWELLGTMLLSGFSDTIIVVGGVSMNNPLLTDGKFLEPCTSVGLETFVTLIQYR